MATPGASSNIYTVVLLRHGESVGNAEGLHQGQTDFALTTTGELQARSLARRWKREHPKFDLAITSPLKRARQTAEIITQALDIPLEIDPQWIERDNGLLSGLRPEDGEQVSPRPMFLNPYQSIGGTGESQAKLFIRASQAVSNLLAHPPGSYLVVSHGGILNLALYAILGIPLQANFTGPRFRLNNAAFTTLSYRPSEHIWTVHGVNDHQHWKGRHE